MENILVDAPPTTIEISGREYDVNYDFRTCLKIILAFEDPELAMVEKSMVLVELLYKDKPKDLQKAIEKGIEFLDGGVEKSESGDLRVFSFQKDARLILAGFRQTYGLDLHETSLHWWDFLTLFLDLSPDTTFSNLVNLRHRVKTGKATKEEREVARDLGDAFRLEDYEPLTIAEMEKKREFYRRVSSKREKAESEEVKDGV